MRDDIGFSKSSILMPFVVGGLMGAAAALLLARSGRGAGGLISQRIRGVLVPGRKVRERMARNGRGVLEGASKDLGKQQESPDQRHNRPWKAGPEPEDNRGSSTGGERGMP